jgi:uncharacterized membrane protein YgcG
MIRKLVLGLIISVLLYLPSTANAQGTDLNNFVIDNFRADYRIDNDKKGGSLTTNETIDLTFSAQNHGIYRAIPDIYHGYKTKLKIDSVKRDGKNEPFETSRSNGNLVLKIGDPDTTITGRHTYTINYYQERVISFQQPPEFTWNVNGTQWQQRFKHVEAYVTYADGTAPADSLACYTGTQGSNTQNCQVSLLADGRVAVSADNLSSNETLTFKAAVPPAMQFIEPTPNDKVRDYIPFALALIPGLLVSLGIFIFWLRRGKDYAGTGIVVPEYDPPKELTPGEVGMLADYKVDSRDVTATLIDMAVRGYIRIHEDVNKILFISSKSYSLELLNVNFDQLKQHERSLMTAIFGGKAAGEMVKLNDLDKVKMQSALVNVKSQLQSSLVETYGLIEKSAISKKVWLALFVSLVVLLTAFGVTENTGFLVSMAIVLITLVLFYSLFTRRSHAGVETVEKIKGLKLYMNTAEKDRLRMMQSTDRPYAEPSKTVDLYEKLLPYAVALGVEKSWSKQFDGILTQAPSWYTGSGANAFTAGYIASGLGDMSSNLGTSFASSTTASSGSGGSFAGGGGGGGGGGGW